MKGLDMKSAGPRDAVVAAALCVFVLMTAGAMSVGGRMHAKTLMCTTNLGKMGQAMAFYISDFDGKLPLLEYYARTPSSYSTVPYVPAIEINYLLSKRLNGATGQSGPMAYRHLGCLYGAGYISDGQSLFCPAITGWRGEPSDMGTNNGTYLGAMHAVTGKFADITSGVSQPNQGWKATKGYGYWPMSTRHAFQMDLDGIYSSSARTLYKQGLPLSATKADDLNMTKPMVTDRKFHSTKSSGWMINCLHPDGHVTYQQQPKAAGLNGNGVQGTWGMHSWRDYCQFPSDICNGVDIISEAEKPFNLAYGVTPTEFAWALQPWGRRKRRKWKVKNEKWKRKKEVVAAMERNRRTGCPTYFEESLAGRRCYYWRKFQPK
jgi:hypothetical protein